MPSVHKQRRQDDDKEDVFSIIRLRGKEKRRNTVWIIVGIY